MTKKKPSNPPSLKFQKLILGGKEYDCRKPVQNWLGHGLTFPVGKGTRRRDKKTDIDLFVLHWTGGEGGASRLFRVLNDRELGVEFCIDRDGVIWQFADPIEIDTFDAGYVNRRSMGVEIVNYGFRRDSSSIPPAGRSRKLEWSQIRGRSIRTAAFYEEQIDSLLALIDAVVDAGHPRIKISRQVPADIHGRLIKETMSKEKVEKYSGVIGHYHISSRKADPGTPIFEKLMYEWDTKRQEADKGAQCER